MRTTYDLYHWRHPDAAADIVSTHPTVALAAYVSGHPDSGPNWPPTADGEGWILDEAETGGKREWGIFWRNVGENDTERAQLALELIARYGQIDGDHHKAWVIDQVTRILAGDGYEQWVTEYRSGEDGPDSYTWDEGVAP